MKKYLLLTALTLIMWSVNFGQTTLVSPTGDGGFETGSTFALNNFTVVNGAANMLTVGSLPTVYAGSLCAYSWNGSTWAGTATASVNHFYRDISFPAGETSITLKFYYKVVSPDAGYDNLKVYLVPTTTAPVAGTQLSSGQLGLTAGYESATSWTQITITIPASAAGTTQRLVFSWKTDSASPYAAVAVDNVELISKAPVTPDSPPVSLTVTGLTQTSMTIGWTDNSTNETGFRLYRSVDNITFSQIGTDVASTTVATTGTAYSSAQTSLIPGVTYYFKIVAYTDLETAPLTGSQATNPAGSIVSTTTGGDWTATGTWVGGVVPVGTDDVTIADGATVTINTTAPVCNNLTVGQGTSGVLRYHATAAATLTVNNGIFISAGATFNAGTGALTTHVLNIGGTTATSSGIGSIVNNGIFDMSTTASVTSNFYGLPGASISGSGGTMDFYRLVLNKGAVTASPTATPPVLEIQRAFTVAGANTAGLVYTHTAGTLKIGGTFTLTTPLYNTAGYSIPAMGGLWLNNANFAATGQTGSPTINGLLRITAGTYNIGTATGNSLGSGSGSVYIIEGGAINVTGRFNLTSTNVYYNQSGGVLTVQKVGNSASSSAGFGITSGTGTTFIMSGGSIIFQLATTGSTPYDYYNIAATRNITGGTLQFGNASTSAAQTFRLYGYAPSVVIDGNKANTVRAGATSSTGSGTTGAIIFGSLNIAATTTFNTYGYYVFAYGDVTNNGSIAGTTSYDRFDFSGLTSQTYSGIGTFGTLAAPFTGVGVGIANPGGVILNAPIYTTRVNLFNGTFTNSNQINLGIGGTSSGYVQLGGGSSTAGVFDVSPVFNIGTGGLTLNYYLSSSAVTTGFEIPASRSIMNLLINNPLGVTLSGGDLTVGTSTAAGLLTLTSGILNTETSSLILPYTGTSISGGSTTSFVDGKIVRSFAANRTATGTYSVATLFPIGKGTTYLPLYVDPTTSAGIVSISGAAFLSNDGSMGSGVNSLSADRWEALITSGSSNFTSAYLRFGDASIGSSNQILQASSSAGEYGAIPSTSTYAAGSPNTLTTTGNQIPLASYSGYFAYGDLTTCETPSAQPTDAVASYNTSTGFVMSFNPADPAPSNYLVVRFAGGTATTDPVNFQTYAIGGALGTGVVRSISGSTTFTETGLTAGTAYDYYIYSYNNSGCYGPVYFTDSPLRFSLTSCATVGTPGTPVGSANTPTGFTATWTASSTSDVTYLLDVATNSAFTSFVSGYEGLDVGVGTLSYSISGLSAATTYYVRVRANMGGSEGCYSVYSSTLTYTTACDPVSSLPWTEGFDAVTIPAFPSCWAKENGDWVTTNNANNSNDADARTGTQFLRETYSATNEYMWTPGFALTGGISYDFSFWWAGDNYAGWTGDVFCNTNQVSTGATQLGSSFVVPATTTTKTYAQVTSSFVPSSTGTYYFAIRINATSAPWYLSFDDFKLELSPSCMPPTALNVLGITSTSATMGWTASVSTPSEGYEYEMRTSGVGGSGSTGLVASGTTAAGVTSALVTGLSASTNYSFYVRSNCGGGLFSSWAGPKTLFTGYCTPAPTSVDGNGITNVTFSSVNNTTGAESGNFGNYSSMIGNVEQNTTVPVLITFETGYTYDTKIWIDWNDDLDFSDSGEEVYTGTSTSTNPTTLSASFAVPVSAPLGNHRMRIGGVDTGPPTPCYASSYGSFEDYTVNVVPPPSCPAPSAQVEANITASSVDLSWTAAGSTSNWDIEIGLFGFTPTGIPSEGLDDVSKNIDVTVSGLASATTYSWYVRADCGSDNVSDVSAWVGPHSFTTLCESATLPYSQDFESAIVPGMPVCTSVQNAGSGNNWVTASAPGSGFTTIALKYVYNTSNPANTWFYTQALDLVGGTAYRISFDYGNNSGTYTEKLKVAYGIQPVNTEMTNLLFNFSSINQNAIQMASADFVPASSGTYYFGFNCYSAADQYNLYVDNILIDATPASTTWTGGAGNSWTSGGNWNNGVPGPYTDVIIPGGLTSYPTLTASASCKNFTIQSDATGTGSILGNSFLSISGTTTIQRYLTKYDLVSDYMFHFLSSPVSAQAIVPEFQTTTSTTTDFYKWGETTNMWINSLSAPNTWNSGFESNMAVGTGYLVAYPADLTKSFHGTMNDSDINPLLSFTPSAGAGWNLIGNPYPSAIDWDNVTSSDYSNLDNAVYVWDNANQSYKTWVAGVGDLTDGIIPAMQGFYVKANAASPALTLKNESRVHGGAAYYKSSAAENMIQLKVTGNGHYDQAFVRFNESATPAFDGQLDAYKLMGATAVPNFYSICGDKKLSVNTLPETGIEEVVSLGLVPGATGSYTLSLVENTLSASYYVTLEDINTGTMQRLNNNPVYTFNAAVGDEPGRFRLHFKDATSVKEPGSNGYLIYALNGIVNVLSDKSLTGSVRVYDMAGRLIKSSVMIPGQATRIDLGQHTGVYLVNVMTREGAVNQKVLVK